MPFDDDHSIDPEDADPDHPRRRESLPDPDAAQDLELVRAVLAGSAAASAELGERMRCLAFFARRIYSGLGLPADANAVDDLAAESTYTALRRLSAFEGHSRLEPWLFNICRLTAFNRARQFRRQHTQEIPDHQASSDGAHEDRLARLEEVARLLDTLGGAEAQVIRQHHLDSRTLREIAERLGKPLATVRSHYNRGMKRLKNRINRIEPGQEES